MIYMPLVRSAPGRCLPAFRDLGMAFSHGKAQGVEWGALQHRSSGRFGCAAQPQACFVAVKSWIYLRQGGPGRLRVRGWVGVASSGCRGSYTTVVVVAGCVLDERRNRKYSDSDLVEIVRDVLDV